MRNMNPISGSGLYFNIQDEKSEETVIEKGQTTETELMLQETDEKLEEKHKTKVRRTNHKGKGK